MINSDKDFTEIIRRLPNYSKLLFALYMDKDINAKQKGILSVGVAYNISPVDLIPGIIPVAGQLDNILIMLWSIRKTLNAVDEPIREKHLKEARITMDMIEEDSRIAKETLKAMGKGAVKLTANGAKIVGYSAKLAFSRLVRKKPY